MLWSQSIHAFSSCVSRSGPWWQQGVQGVQQHRCPFWLPHFFWRSINTFFASKKINIYNLVMCARWSSLSGVQTTWSNFSDAVAKPSRAHPCTASLVNSLGLSSTLGHYLKLTTLLEGWWRFTYKSRALLCGSALPSPPQSEWLHYCRWSPITSDP